MIPEYDTTNPCPEVLAVNVAVDWRTPVAVTEEGTIHIGSTVVISPVGAADMTPVERLAVLRLFIGDMAAAADAALLADPLLADEVATAIDEADDRVGEHRKMLEAEPW